MVGGRYVATPRSDLRTRGGHGRQPSQRIKQLFENAARLATHGLSAANCEGMGPCALSLVTRATIITLLPRRRGEGLLPLHRHHAAFLDCERQPSLLERERPVSGHLPPPA